MDSDAVMEAITYLKDVLLDIGIVVDDEDIAGAQGNGPPTLPASGA